MADAVVVQARTGIGRFQAEDSRADRQRTQKAKTHAKIFHGSSLRNADFVAVYTKVGELARAV
jgi:hypothetical protein